MMNIAKFSQNNERHYYFILLVKSKYNFAQICVYFLHCQLLLQVRLAVSGCVSAHSVIVTEDGKAMTFGRNQFGQLGLDNTTTKEVPTIVPALGNMNVISAACGRNHTLFLTDTGTVYACGDNRSGQCGVGNLQPNIVTPTRINYRGPPIVKVK